MKPNFRQRLFYRFERFLNKGGSSIFKTLFFIFISAFGFIILLRYILLFLFPELDYLENFGDHIWVTFLQMTAPGNMNQDTPSPIWLKVTSVLAGFAGVVLLSMLIAFITSSLNSLLYNFRKGRGPVFEKDHTIILGWNDRVVDVMKELILANESEKKATIVVLADYDKELMDDLITKRIPDSKTTEIITTNGDPANISELNRINITNSKSVIILAKCSENASFDEKIASDIQAIKSILAIKSCQNNESNLPVIAEVFSQEKRDIIEYFNDDNLIALDSWTIMGKLIMQTSLTSGLQLVYNEILSFDGGEVYFYHAEWGSIRFVDLVYHFEDGIPIGVYNESDGLLIRPGQNYQMKPEDEILILAEDDSTIKYKNAVLYQANTLPISEKRLSPSKKKTLLLGWHSIAEIFISEANDYLADGSSFDIMYHDPSPYIIEKVNNFKEQFPNFKIQLIDENPMIRAGLLNVDPNLYDNILVLSQKDETNDPDKVDSDTLIILLLLRERIQGPTRPKIITQVLNSENQKLINQTDVDDFVISNKLITMILAQLSEEPKIKLLYDDIFSEEGSEIYVKPANLYFTTFPQSLKFVDIIGVAFQRDEICLGIRKGALLKDIDKNFGVRLNIPKNEAIVIEEGDFLVVLSEDEL
jgi:hypothetical protein